MYRLTLTGSARREINPMKTSTNNRTPSFLKRQSSLFTHSLLLVLCCVPLLSSSLFVVCGARSSLLPVKRAQRRQFGKAMKKKSNNKGEGHTRNIFRAVSYRTLISGPTHNCIQNSATLAAALDRHCAALRTPLHSTRLDSPLSHWLHSIDTRRYKCTGRSSLDRRDQVKTKQERRNTTPRHGGAVLLC